ncbi:Exodeoxyribonuclease III [Minicystis rosea]|nr:Exodeoxyribonuclease III [Minicystis rosea]
MVAADGSVTFVHRDAAASKVLVAGDFTGWERAPIALARAAGSDVWTARTGPLAPGLHTYKLVIDGRWVGAPAGALGYSDGFGGRNAAFVVGARPLGEPSAVRVASLNLHTYQERNPLDKIEQIAVAMAAMDADLLLLQEVGEHVSDPARPNAGEVLRRHLEANTAKTWHHVWREAHIGFDVYREGLSILSSAPIDDVTTVRLSDKGLARIAVLGTTELRGIKLRAGTTHISWEPADGEAEAQRLLAALDAAPGRGIDAILIAGDFNTGASGRPIQRFVAQDFIDVGAAAGVVSETFLDAPRERIDYHFLRRAIGRAAPRIEGFARTFDGDTRRGYQPRVSDHAGLIGAYAWG